MIYKSIITLNRNARGCYILDTVKGCSYARLNPGGCYGDCYAANIAKRYGFDFGNPVKRYFIEDDQQLYFNGYNDIKHEASIIKQIKNIDMPFVRIGEMGDPSEYWEHTLDVCKNISIAGKKIVIITKHLKTLPNVLLHKLNNQIIINTSISALDSKQQIKHRLKQYNRLKPYCKSVLRVVTCDFKIDHFNKIQMELLDNENVLETIFRPNPKNDLVIDGVIGIEKRMFLKSEVWASSRIKGVFFGYCKDCKEMCGVNTNTGDTITPENKGYR